MGHSFGIEQILLHVLVVELVGSLAVKYLCEEEFVWIVRRILSYFLFERA